jgi:hypothetical protein
VSKQKTPTELAEERKAAEAQGTRVARDLYYAWHKGIDLTTARVIPAVQERDP